MFVFLIVFLVRIQDCFSMSYCRFATVTLYSVMRCYGWPPNGKHQRKIGMWHTNRGDMVSDKQHKTIQNLVTCNQRWQARNSNRLPSKQRGLQTLAVSESEGRSYCICLCIKLFVYLQFISSSWQLNKSNRIVINFIVFMNNKSYAIHHGHNQLCKKKEKNNSTFFSPQTCFLGNLIIPKAPETKRTSLFLMCIFQGHDFSKGWIHFALCWMVWFNAIQFIIAATVPFVQHLDKVGVDLNCGSLAHDFSVFVDKFTALKVLDPSQKWYVAIFTKYIYTEIIYNKKTRNSFSVSNYDNYEVLVKICELISGVFKKGQQRRDRLRWLVCSTLPWQRRRCQNWASAWQRFPSTLPLMVSMQLLGRAEMNCWEFPFTVSVSLHFDLVNDSWSTE